MDVMVTECAAVIALSLGVQKQSDALEVGVGGAQLLFDALHHIGFGGVTDLDEARSTHPGAADSSFP